MKKTIIENNNIVRHCYAHNIYWIKQYVLFSFMNALLLLLYNLISFNQIKTATIALFFKLIIHMNIL